MPHPSSVDYFSALALTQKQKARFPYCQAQIRFPFLVVMNGRQISTYPSLWRVAMVTDSCNVEPLALESVPPYDVAVYTHITISQEILAAASSS